MNAPSLRSASAGVLLGLRNLGIATESVSADQAPGLVLHDQPQPVQAVTFEDGEGRSLALADFRGRIVLLNIWATWCAPCRHEMPTLDRLQRALGGADFEVVALSIDRKGASAVAGFYEEIGIEALQLYVDPSGAAQRALRVVGIPTTLLLDREGRELGRLAGPAEWDSPTMVDWLQSLIRTTAAAERSDQQPTTRRSVLAGSLVHRAQAATKAASPLRSIALPGGVVR
jgi:thiol-disulfide isomerase/thioredoxin